MTYENETCEGCLKFTRGCLLIENNPRRLDVCNNHFAPNLECRAVRALEAIAATPPIIVIPPGEWTAEHAEEFTKLVRSIKSKAGQ